MDLIHKSKSEPQTCQKLFFSIFFLVSIRPLVALFIFRSLLIAPGLYTVKKASRFPVLSRDATNQTIPGRKYLNYSRRGRVLFVTSRLVTENG